MTVDGFERTHPARLFEVRGVWADDPVVRGFHDPHAGVTEFEFPVLGREPGAAGSFRCANVRGHCQLLAGGSESERRKARDWRKLVAELARDAAAQIGLSEPLDEPVSVTIGFVLSKPPSLPKWRLWARSKPDLDKLARSTLDAMTDAGIWVDDGRVVELHLCKRYSIPTRTPRVGAIVAVRALGGVERLAGRA